MLRPIQWDVRLYSFISRILSMTKNPAKGTPYAAEIANPTGASIHRKIRAWKTVIRPDGIGRQGLFITSSLGERLWFDTQNCMRWISNQNIAWRRRRGVVVGTAIATKLVYHFFSGQKCHNQDNAHYWQQNSVHIWFCEQIQGYQDTCEPLTRYPSDQREVWYFDRCHFGRQSTVWPFQLNVTRLYKPIYCVAYWWWGLGETPSQPRCASHLYIQCYNHRVRSCVWTVRKFTIHLRRGSGWLNYLNQAEMNFG
jgi:hypothetical protein